MKTAFQTFALDKAGKIISIKDVVSGLACQCTCPSCGGNLIARKGEIKTWHFAHHQAECNHAAESALHLAAKEVIKNHCGVDLPRKDLLMSTENESNNEERWIKFDEVTLEAPIAGLKADCLGRIGNELYIIEIKVTHEVDPDKAERLIALDAASIEIDLSTLHHEAWDWEALTKVVLHDQAIRHWINPYMEQPQNEAQEPDQEAKSVADNQIFGERIYGTYVNVYEYHWGTVVRFQWNSQVTNEISSLAKTLGGRFNRKYKNWIFGASSEVKQTLLSKLRKLT